MLLRAWSRYEYLQADKQLQRQRKDNHTKAAGMPLLQAVLLHNGKL